MGVYGMRTVQVYFGPVLPVEGPLQDPFPRPSSFFLNSLLSFYVYQSFQPKIVEHLDF